jgi:hypothetical protein
MRVIALHGVAAARPAHTVSPGGAGSAPPHLDAIVARLCPVCRALPALGHGGRRALAGRGAVDANGKVLIEAFSISGMAHGVPLATTTGGESCGAAGAFFLDVGISSTHHIARFWRLHESLVEMPRGAVPVSAPTQIPTDGRASSREQPPKDRIVRPKLRLLGGKNGRRVTRSTRTT